MKSKILNFSDETVVSFNFKPTKNTLKNEEKQMQTDPQKLISVACETKQESIEIGTQYDATESNQSKKEIDESSLLIFLRKKKNLLMDAFQEQSTQSLSGKMFRGTKTASQTNCTQKLQIQFGSADIKNEVQINQVKLNNKGMMLAVAVGYKKHEGSCEHTAYVCGWNIFRSNIKSDEPHWTLNSNGCVTCISWHPRKSTILATGTYNGIISIFDIGKEEGNPIQYQTQLNEFLHYDTVSCLDWSVYKINNNLKVQLVSTSLDGKQYHLIKFIA